MNIKEKQQVMKLRSEGLGYKKIANELNISINTIKSFCRNNYLTSEYMESKTCCKECGKELNQIGHMKVRQFCSCKCKQAWWNQHRNQAKRTIMEEHICPNCEKTFHAYARDNRKYCSHTCYINARFKKGDNHE